MVTLFGGHVTKSNRAYKKTYDIDIRHILPFGTNSRRMKWIIFEAEFYFGN